MSEHTSSNYRAQDGVWYVGSRIEVKSGGSIKVLSGGKIQFMTGSAIVPNSGTQATAITAIASASGTLTAGDRTKINNLLTALRGWAFAS